MRVRPGNMGRRAGSLAAVQVVAGAAWMGRAVAVRPGRGPPEVAVLQLCWGQGQVSQWSRNYLTWAPWELGTDPAAGSAFVI